MKKKSLLAVALVLSMLSTSFLGNGYSLTGQAKKEQVVFASSGTSETVTVGQMADFLLTKKEHYPLSDQFMERYQQTSGGYLDNAKKAGIPVDREQHSPNQKWHFFESWYYPSIEEGSLSREDDAKRRIYTNLLCPELLLWIYEAAGVAPAKVKKAMEAAEAGKSSGAAVTSIAKNMRACVAWEDIAAAFQVKVPAESVSLSATTLELEVGESATIRAAVLPANATDGGVWTLVEGEDVLSITPKGNETTVRGLKEGSAKVKVTYNATTFAECIVTVVKKQAQPDPLPSAGAYTYTISYDLGTRVTAKQIESEQEVYETFALAGEGAGIIQSVGDIEYIYGGGHGGQGETKWYTGDMLKFGTTNVNGSLTLRLTSAVNYVKIIGYVYGTTCTLTVGGEEFICADMNVVGKETVEGGQVSTALITFASTDVLTIATTNKKPLFIVGLELGYNADLEN